MSSERRLHPYSIGFAFLTQIRLFVVPGILVAVGASSRSNDDWWQWQPWMMLLIVPNALFAVVRYLTYRYSYEERELVIRSGLLFRRERHVPYARIQNIDAVQNLLHRLLNVVEVKLETGGGESAEATMSVLPIAAFHEMRQRVFADRHAAEEPVPAGAPPLLTLDVRELMLCGLIENRGGVLMAAAFGVVWEVGLFDRVIAPMFDVPTAGRGVLRNFARSLYTNATVSWERLALAFVAFVAFLCLIRLLSMAWAVVRLHGFTLSLVDDDARSEFGLLTRVATTIPLRRVQSLTVREGPLHRYFGRVAVNVDTAGGGKDEQNKKTNREYLAPILQKPALVPFVRSIVGVDLGAVAWNGTHPRAFRREVKVWLGIALVILAAVFASLGSAAAVLLAPPLMIWAIVAAHQQIKHMRWAEVDDAILYADGWLWRRVIVVRFAKIQVVTRHESPFDRRSAMASLHVDTAGSSVFNVVRIRYLAESVADALHARLAAVAAGTHFKW